MPGSFRLLSSLLSSHLLRDYVKISWLFGVWQKNITAKLSQLSQFYVKLRKIKLIKQFCEDQ